MFGRRTKTVAGAVAALALALALPMTAANAATESVELTNTGGSITLASQPALALPASNVSIAGDWDTTANTFTGQFTANPIPSTVQFLGNPINITVDIDATSDLTGDLDNTDGFSELDATFTVKVNILLDPNPANAIVCTLGPINGTLETDLSGGAAFDPVPFDPSSNYSMTLVMEGAPVAALADSACAVPGIAASVNTQLGLPGTASMVLPLVRGTAVPPTTPPTSAPTSSTTAAPAAATSPRFTG